VEILLNSEAFLQVSSADFFPWEGQIPIALRITLALTRSSIG
jgi:hypothetical protein